MNEFELLLTSIDVVAVTAGDDDKDCCSSL
jgi:hypothetical protein